jgi:hypothetical protein
MAHFNLKVVDPHGHYFDSGFRLELADLSPPQSQLARLELQLIWLYL